MIQKEKIEEQKVDGRVLRKEKNQERIRQELRQFDNDPKLFLHHVASVTGYKKRSSGLYVTGYNGRFGVGYKVETPSWAGTQYHTVYYYMFKPTQNKN